MEGARAWSKAKSKEKARITRIASEDREKAKLEADDRVRKKPTLFRGQRRRLSPR